MTTFDTAAVNAAFERIFTNGVGEAGLEVGLDPGLPTDQYIQIPESMVKRWAARYSAASWETLKAAALKLTPPVTLPATMAEWGGDYAAQAGRAGWVTSGQLLVQGGSLWHRHVATGKAVKCDVFHIEPFTADDVRNFVTVNIGHIRDADFSRATQCWIHACRFWSVTAGLVASTKSAEHVTVANPTAIAQGIDDICIFIAGFSANAWTAAAARAASWRKTNHATGGGTVQGFPRRWLNKMGYIEAHADRAAMSAHMRNVTNAFYVATHACSVHSVLALMAPDDKDHWAEVKPEFGLVPKWDIGTSAKIRMIPKTQIAGAAIVVDSIVVLKMAIKEGVAPLIGSLSQVDALVEAYEEVETNGIRCAVYAKWFLEGNWDGFKPVDFNQKDAAFADLAGELAVVGTKYYAGSTIAGSMALQNAASQLGSPDAHASWAALAAQRRQLSSAQVIAAVAAIKGASAAGAVAQILTSDEATIRQGVDAYNKVLEDLADKLDGVEAPTINADKVVAARLPQGTAGPEA